MESKTAKLADELAKLAIVKAIRNVSATTLVHYVDEADPDGEKLDPASRMLVIAEARKILDNAVDASEWVVGMTTEKLEPYNGILKFYGGDGENSDPIMWLHFGFGELVEPEHREGMVKEIGSMILAEL